MSKILLYTEIEKKFTASSEDCESVNVAAMELGPEKVVRNGSWDYYYINTSQNSDCEFIRYRDSQKSELTVKRKTNGSNYIREEIDVPIKSSTNLRESKEILVAVERFVELMGFKFNFKIYKAYAVFMYEKTSVCFYSVSDENMNVIGRFIEVEARKDVDWVSVDEASLAVDAMIVNLLANGMTIGKVEQRSQWELWRVPLVVGKAS